MANKILSLCSSLYKTIVTGDINNSSKYAEDLARLKPVIKIIPDVMIIDKWNIEYCELTNVIVQDIDNETTIDYYISNFVTIDELKKQVLDDCLVLNQFFFSFLKRKFIFFLI
jgi:hypothetical protein